MGLIISIIIAIIFSESVKSKIRAGEKFDGLGWGLLCGLFGAGLIPAAIAYGSVNTTLDVSDNGPNYKDRARQELKRFWKTYIICFVCWLLLGIFAIIISYDA